MRQLPLHCDAPKLFKCISCLNTEIVITVPHLIHCEKASGKSRFREEFKSAAPIFIFTPHRPTHNQKYTVRTITLWLDQSSWHFNPLHLRTSSHTLLWCAWQGKWEGESAEVDVCVCVCLWASNAMATLAAQGPLGEVARSPRACVCAAADSPPTKKKRCECVRVQAECRDFHF